jgi:hypothetical protein
MGRKTSSSVQKKKETIRTLDDVGSDAERALIDLDGALTAARAIVDLTLADGGADEGPILYKRLNALEFLLRQAGHSESVLWVAVDQMSMALDEQAPAPF